MTDYEQKFMFNLWCAFVNEDYRQKILEFVKEQEENELEVAFSIYDTTKKIKNLCELRTETLLIFDKPVFDDDYIVLKINKDEFIKNFEWFKENLKRVEVNNTKFTIHIQ